MKRLITASTLMLSLTFSVMAESTENNFIGSLTSGTIKADQNISTSSDKVVLQWGKVINATDYTLDQLSCSITALGKKISIQKAEQFVLKRINGYTTAAYFLENGKTVNVYTYGYTLTNKKQKLSLTCQTTQTSTTVKNLQETVWEAFKLQTTNFSKN